MFIEVIYYNTSDRGNKLTQSCIEYGFTIDSSVVISRNGIAVTIHGIHAFINMI